jgi:NAD(P)-dependent dehydrogenase (short-subunit alcohol dehydrogenase family)
VSGRLAGKVAIVTGGTSGIGEATVRLFVKEGARVVVVARHETKPVDGTRFVAGDVTDRRTAHSAVEAAEQWGGVDVLVNNAAVLVSESRGVLTTKLDDFRATLTTNVVGPLAVCQAFVPGMVRRKYGRVVNVSSTAGQLASMGTYAPAYAISKAALNAVTRQVAAATQGTGVLVNSACPGWVRTRMGGSGAPRSVEQGADTIVWLATLPAGGPTGGFFRDRRSIEW